MFVKEIEKFKRDVISRKNIIPIEKSKDVEDKNVVIVNKSIFCFDFNVVVTKMFKELIAAEDAVFDPANCKYLPSL